MTTTAPTEDADLASDLETLIRRLPAELARIDDDAELVALGRRVARVPGVRKADFEVAHSVPTIAIEPMDAQRVCELLGLQAVLVVSPDVHQKTWMLVMKEGDEWVDEYRNRRVPAEVPRYGVWDLRIQVDNRPGSKLPRVSWGPSPAYPLAGSGVKVKAISIRRRR